MEQVIPDREAFEEIGQRVGGELPAEQYRQAQAVTLMRLARAHGARTVEDMLELLAAGALDEKIRSHNQRLVDASE